MDYKFVIITLGKRGSTQDCSNVAWKRSNYFSTVQTVSVDRLRYTDADEARTEALLYNIPTNKPKVLCAHAIGEGAFIRTQRTTQSDTKHMIDGHERSSTRDSNHEEHLQSWIPGARNWIVCGLQTPKRYPITHPQRMKNEEYQTSVN